MGLSVAFDRLLRPEDEDFHRNPDALYQAEGSWWCFFNAERRIAGWVYHITRLNIGMASGGVWVWDDTATQWYEIPYFSLQHLQPVAADVDYRDMRWADGVSIRSLEPFKRYDVTYRDPGRLELDLRYEALGAPFVSASGEPPVVGRFEQLSRARGSLVLNGESIAIDCIAMFDHSWGPRPERHGGSGGGPRRFADHQAPYLWGAASPDEAFFVMAGTGVLVSQGRRADVPQVRQTIERDPTTGHICTMRVTGVDTLGRRLDAVGRPQNLIVRPSAGASVGFIYTMEWRFGGREGLGDVQDVLAAETWAACRREALAVSA
jgi:hypothetical protein